MAVNKTLPEQWFAQIIAEGLAHIYLLRLEHSPAADTLEAVIDVWIQSLWSRRSWNCEQDSVRLREGFTELAVKQIVWPAPASLLQALPERPPVPPLPELQMSEEQKKRNKARLAELLSQLGSDTKVQPKAKIKRAPGELERLLEEEAERNAAQKAS